MLNLLAKMESFFNPEYKVVIRSPQGYQQDIATGFSSRGEAHRYIREEASAPEACSVVRIR